MTPYTKPVYSTEEHIELLINKKLLKIDDPKYANKKINSIGYYRLSQYFKPFLYIKNGEDEEKFHNNETFKDIINIYDFDRKLRLKVFDLIEIIEIDLKAKLIDILAGVKNDPFAYLDPELFSKDKHEIFMRGEKNHKNVDSIISKPAFLYHEIGKHWKTKYADEDFPTIWMLLNNVDFGFLHVMYSHLSIKIQKKIIKKYGYYNPTAINDFQNLIKTINTIRNKIAHHDRLYNTIYNIKLNNTKIRITFLKLLDYIGKIEEKIKGRKSTTEGIIEYYNETQKDIIN